MDMGSDFAAAARGRQNMERIERITAIIRDSGGREWEDAMAHANEHYSHLPHYQRQLRAKQQIVERHPNGGTELWAWFVASMSPEYRPHT
jgi:hypothetical protein